MASFKKVIAKNEDVLRLIPQRPPMVMIDSLLEIQESKTFTTLTVRADNPFFKDGYLREPGIIENIAQTAAAGAGYRMSLQNPAGEPPVGFIGALKNLVIHSLPAEGELLETEVDIEFEVMDATLIKGFIKIGKKFVAECEMKIFTKS